MTLRKRFITAAGIDALFGVTLDPTYFKNFDMTRRAKLATFMAVVIWAYPLTAILTPGTIPVQTVAQINQVPCTVQTPAFEFDTASKAQKHCCQDTTLTDVSAGPRSIRTLSESSCWPHTPDTSKPRSTSD